jgi:TPR repeat protein
LRGTCSAAEEGDISMQFNVGLLYFNGIQVEQDKGEAIRLFTMAAKQSDVAAQNRLASIYRGDVIPKDKRGGEMAAQSRRSI